MSLYEALGVDSSASHAELKRAYRVALRTSHPDTGGSPEAFRAVQDAWEVLGDVSHRRTYDANSKLSSFGTSSPAPDGYREHWNAGYQDGSRTAKSAFWDSYDEDMVGFYKEQNEKFRTAKNDARQYAEGEYEAMEPHDNFFIEAMRPMWLKFMFLIVVVISFAAVLITAPMPAYLGVVLIGVGIADAVIIAASILIATFLNLRSRFESDEPIYLMGLVGVVFALAVCAFIMSMNVVNMVSEISLIADTLTRR